MVIGYLFLVDFGVRLKRSSIRVSKDSKLYVAFTRLTIVQQRTKNIFALIVCLKALENPSFTHMSLQPLTVCVDDFCNLFFFKYNLFFVLLCKLQQNPCIKLLLINSIASDLYIALFLIFHCRGNLDISSKEV